MEVEEANPAFVTELQTQHSTREEQILPIEKSPPQDTATQSVDGKMISYVV